MVALLNCYDATRLTQLMNGRQIYIYNYILHT